MCAWPRTAEWRPSPGCQDQRGCNEKQIYIKSKITINELVQWQVYKFFSGKIILLLMFLYSRGRRQQEVTNCRSMCTSVVMNNNLWPVRAYWTAIIRTFLLETKGQQMPCVKMPDMLINTQSPPVGYFVWLKKKLGYFVHWKRRPKRM